VWVPLFAEVSATDAVNGDELSVPITVVPSRKSTPETPTLSFAVAVRFSVPAVVTVALDALSSTVGGVVSPPPPPPPIVIG